MNIDSSSGLQTEATHTHNVVAHGNLSFFFFSCFVMKTHPAGTVDIAMASGMVSMRSV